MAALSLVIPTLEEAPRIGPLLRALHPLLGPHDEALVVDGGSRDGTAARARALGLPRVRVLESPRPGRAAQMNHGAAAAAGEWLLFLHADAGVEPALLDALRAAGPDVAWGFGRVRLDEPGAAYRLIEAAIDARSRAFGTPSGDQGIFVRRPLFAAVGGYPDVPFLEDLLLVDRLRRRAPPWPLRRRVWTSARRWRRHGVARTVLRMWALRAAFRLGVPPERLARAYRPVR